MADQLGPGGVEDISHLMDDGSGGSPTPSDVEDISHLMATPDEGGAPTATDRMKAAGEAGARGAITTGPAVAGFYAGAQAGAPAGPWGSLVLGLVGGIAGYFAGSEAADVFGLRSPEQMPPELRPSAYFGEALGGTVGGGGTTISAAKTGFRVGRNAVGGFLDNILESAARSPKRFAIVEGSSGLSSATAAGVSEQVSPGNTPLRIGAELTAGVLNPTRLAVSAAYFAKDKVLSVIQTMGPAGKETAAAKLLIELHQQTGENPEMIARILRQQGEVKGLTGAQRTGSPALAALEDHIAKESPRYGAEWEGRAKDGLDYIRLQSELLMRTGDPNAMRAAIELRSTYYKTLIASRLESSVNAARDAAGKISRDTPEARAALSLKARQAIDESITSVRAAEKELWSKVDGNRPVEVTSFRQTFNEIKDEVVLEYRPKDLPKEVEDFLKRVTKTTGDSQIYDPALMTYRTVAGQKGGTTVGELRKLRGKLLEESRKAAYVDDYGQARIYSNLAEAALDDIDTAFRGTSNTAYAEARTFTRELNDTFMRSFVGRATATGKYGDRIAPELLLRRALASGGEAADIHLSELEEATRFMVTRGLSDDASVTTMMQAQESFLRIAAAEAIDPLTGRVSQQRVAKFLDKNAALLKRFPEVRDDLQAALTSEAKARGIEALTKRQNVMVENNLALATTLKKDPTAAAMRVFVSTDPSKELDGLVRAVADKTGKILDPAQQSAAQKGLTASLFRAAIVDSMRDGTLNLKTFRNRLFKSGVADQKSVIDLMVEKGLIDKSQRKRIDDLLTAGERITASQRPSTRVDVRETLPDILMKTVQRIIGSRVATTASRMSGADLPPLIVAQSGANISEKILGKLPKGRVVDMLAELMTDHEALAKVYSKVDTDEQVVKGFRQLNMWMHQTGITGVTDFSQMTPEEKAKFREKLPPALRMTERLLPGQSQ